MKKKLDLFILNEDIERKVFGWGKASFIARFLKYPHRGVRLGGRTQLAILSTESKKKKDIENHTDLLLKLHILKTIERTTMKGKEKEPFACFHFMQGSNRTFSWISVPSEWIKKTG